MSYVIYEAINPINDKRYIGKTIDLRKRKWSHRALAKKRPDLVFYRAILKYGFDTFRWHVLSTHRVAARALAAEVKWIKQRREAGITLYNMTDGGEGGKGAKMSAEIRKKIGDSLRGFKHSAETRAKLSQIGLGRPKSTTTRIRLSAAQNKSSKYQGVGWRKENQNWCARIRWEGRHLWLGAYVTEIEAHEAYQEFWLTHIQGGNKK